MQCQASVPQSLDGTSYFGEFEFGVGLRMAGDNQAGLVSVATGISHAKAILSAISGIAVAGGTIVYLGLGYIDKINASEKKLEELQQQISFLQKERDNLSTQLSKQGDLLGIAGPRGPTGLQGEKGDKGDKGEPGPAGPAGDSVSIADIRKMISDAIRQAGVSPTSNAVVPSSTASAATPQAAAGSECTVFNPSGDKVRLVVSEGMTFCLADGEKVATVRIRPRETWAPLNFENPGGTNWTCAKNETCKLGFVGGYQYVIEQVDGYEGNYKLTLLFKRGS